jgi:hypothetical protein
MGTDFREEEMKTFNEMPAIIIGNGKSRLQFDLDQLKTHGVTFGCNGIYRDFSPDYLVAMDRNMVDEIIDHKAYMNSVFYTQYDNAIEKKIIRDRLPINFTQPISETNDSGTSAVKLASGFGFTRIFMIGFDYISEDPHKLNNVYAGTKNYGPHENHIHERCYDRWRSHLKRVIMANPQVEYYRVNLNNYEPNIRLTNYHNITKEQFSEHIQTR